MTILLIRLRAGLLLTKSFLHPMMIAGPLYLMWVSMVTIWTVIVLETRCITQIVHISVIFGRYGKAQYCRGEIENMLFRYACSGFSLIGFYLVTVLEEANIALPPLEVILIIMVIIINTIISLSSPINSWLNISIGDLQASLILVIWRLLLSLLSSFLLLRCTF